MRNTKIAAGKFENGTSSAQVNATVYSQWISLEDFSGFYLQAKIAGGSSPTGSLKLQSSFDGSTAVDVANSATAFTDNGSTAWNVDRPHYPLVRLAWAATSGTGELTFSFAGTNK